MIKLLETDPITYDAIFGENITIFHTAKYHQLHLNKIDKIWYLVFEGQDFKVGIIGGSIDNTFVSPISAPYGGFGYNQPNLSIEKINATVLSLLQFIKIQGLSACKITPLAGIFNQSIFTNFLNAFFVNGFKIEEVNINHHMTMDVVKQDLSYLDSTATKMLKQAWNHGLTLKLCSDSKEKELAYEIIKINRTEKNKPLRMSYEDLTQSCQLIPNDFFLVYSKENDAIASAIVFKIAPDKMQIIYWGNTSISSPLRPMNFLAHHLFLFYKNKGINIIDIGISTEDSKPNFGLCRFKDSIGCTTSLKVVLRYES